MGASSSGVGTSSSAAWGKNDAVSSSSLAVVRTVLAVRHVSAVLRLTGARVGDGFVDSWGSGV